VTTNTQFLTQRRKDAKTQMEEGEGKSEAALEIVSFSLLVNGSVLTQTC